MPAKRTRRLVCHAYRDATAFSLVELLAAIAIISVLIALLLPAIQSSREAGRRCQCQNNLRQISVSLLSYHETYLVFPNGGWGHEWVGDPDRGVGIRQPGGWIYCVLPFMDEAPLHDRGKGTVGANAVVEYSTRLQASIPTFNCPSRRPCCAWPISDKYPYVRVPKPFGSVVIVARADFAINGGASNAFSFGGPADLAQGDDSQFWLHAQSPINFNGISHLHTSVGIKSVEDGASKTYLIGEKYIEASKYESGESIGDNESMYAGYCTDLHRFTGSMESFKIGLPPWSPPIADTTDALSGPPGTVRFGSAHPSTCNIANCDGSISAVAYDIDPEIHFRAGYRNDGGAALNQLK